MEENYIESVIKQFRFYKSLGEKTFAQLNDDQLLWEPVEDINSIAVIVNHMWGNMKSRWTDFLTSDGEKEWRNRDEEFENVIETREELTRKWEEGWECVFEALAGINPTNFDKIIYIRNIGHSIPEAVNRQLGHYAYHVGQIVFLGKILKGKDWTTLSIPKGESKAYNAKKFAKDKHRGHFTEEFLDEK
ncbi:MAG: DUF1572 family protein [Bacteroidota bacterium]